LARRLGVTRAAIWKQIEALRALGAPIEARAGAGYRLGWPFELLDAARIWAELDATTRRRLGALEVHWQIDSTNTALLRAAAAGAADLSVCVAETQSAGRGRRGRTWLSPLCGNVYVSLLKRFERGMGSLAGLSLVAGLAVLRALADCGVAGAGLKWPNDVWVDGGKLAGVLVELGGEFLGPCFAVVGVGINLRLPKASVREPPAIDLARLCDGTPPSRHRLLGCLLRRAIELLDRFAIEGFAAFREEYAKHDRLRGRAVHVQLGGRQRLGVAEGVDARGALCVRHGAELVCYDSAEVTVRDA
jgi:BirA family biotin operon repressor/biotin-[acetyl-CoA-carboxylase] ligase